MEATAISAKNVSMMFNLSRDKNMGIREYAIKALRRELSFDEYWALRDVTFDVKKVEIFGIMGLNGAGKSTLLKIITGVFTPTGGTVAVIGKIAPLLELGAGFDNDYSARENVFMNGAMFGHSPKYMAAKYDEIIDFAEVREFDDVPLKNFSSGMKARLGFAVAANVQPDVLILDEILGVGDHKFRAKCRKRIDEMILQGVTVLMASHDISQIRNKCSRALLLRKGRCVYVGAADKVCQLYEKEG